LLLYEYERINDDILLNEWIYFEGLYIKYMIEKKFYQKSILDELIKLQINIIFKVDS
jgi:hypothetical protein